MRSTIRNLTLLAALVSNFAGMMALAQTNRSVGAKGSWVYVGTRGAPPKPDAPAGEIEQYNKSPQGIYAMELDAETGKLTPLGLQIPLPGVPWLLAHPTLPVIYTFDIEGGQTSPNNVYSFAVDVTDPSGIRRLAQFINEFSQSSPPSLPAWSGQLAC